MSSLSLHTNTSSSTSSGFSRITNFFFKPDPLVQQIEKGSLEEIVELVKNDLSAQLTQNQITLKKRNVIDLIEQRKSEAILEKAGLTNEKLLEKCLQQGEFVEKWQKNLKQAKVQSAFKRVFPTVFNFTYVMIDTALAALGYYKLGRGSQNQYEAAELLKFYLELLLFPATIFFALSQVISSPLIVVTATFGILAIALITLTVYVTYFKPCPDELEGFRNLTTDAKKGLLPPVYGRDAEIDDLIARLSRKEGVVLVGPSGVGKTELVNGLAQRLVSQKETLPEHLKNLKIFSINTSRIATFASNWQLSDIENQLMGYERQVILFFDEIHAAWKGEDNQLGNNLKTFIDRFCYTIAATTQQEYVKYVANESAITRRLKYKKVDRISQEKSEVALSKFFLQNGFHEELNADIIPYLVKQTQEQHPMQSEPLFSLGILSEASQRVNCDPKNVLKQKIADQEDQIEKLETAYAQGHAKNLVDTEDVYQALRTKKEELDRTQKQLQEQEKQLSQLQQIRTLWNQVKTEIFETSLAIKGNSWHRQKLMQTWLVKTYVILPALEKLIQEYSIILRESGIRTHIDKELIDQLLAEKSKKTEHA